MNIKLIREKVKRPLFGLQDEQVLQLVRDYLEYSAFGSTPENSYFRECATKYNPDLLGGMQLLGMSMLLLNELCFRFNGKMTLEQLMN
jgi:hypothetical protein